MGRTADDLAEVIDAVDLPALVESFTSGRRSGTGWTYNCPNPDHADRSPSFSVYRTAGSPRWLYKCHGCGAAGDALTFLERFGGRTRSDAVAELRDRTGLRRLEPLHRDRKPKRATRATSDRSTTRPVDHPDRSTGSATVPTCSPPPDTAETVRVPATAAAPIMADYLAGRGWPDTVPDRFGLEVVRGTDGRPAIRHPYHRPDPAMPGTGWRVHGWQDRATSPDTRAKWNNPPGVSLPPYNLGDTVRDVGVLIVCEGPADTITAATALEAVQAADLAAVIGLPGSKWPPEMDALLRRRWSLVIVATDGDGPGRRYESTAAVAAIRGRNPVKCYRSPNPAEDMTDLAKRVGLEPVGRELIEVIGFYADDTRGGAA